MLEQLGALSAILTFLGAIGTGVIHFGQKYSRRRAVERYLAVIRDDESEKTKYRWVSQIAIELGMTEPQAYEAASRNKRLKRGSYSGQPGHVWFAAPDLRNSN